MVKHDRENCIGCGACVSICPSFWKMGDDGKAELIGNKGNQKVIGEKGLKCNKDAEAACPVNVIQVEEM